MGQRSLQKGPEKTGNPERPSNEAMKVKPGLHWRLEDVADARAMGYLSRRDTHRKWNQEKERERERCCWMKKWKGRAS